MLAPLQFEEAVSGQRDCGKRERGGRRLNNVAPFVAVAVVAVEEVSSILNIKQKKGSLNQCP